RPSASSFTSPGGSAQPAPPSGRAAGAPTPEPAPGTRASGAPVEFGLGIALVPRPVMLPGFWVASTKPEAALVRGQGWLPWQGRGWTLAPRESGPEVGVRCWTGHWGLDATSSGPVGQRTRESGRA